MQRPTRKQLQEALDTVPIDQVLSVPGQLTHKQKTFAREVALGATKADAYRKAYKANPAPSSLRSDPYKIAGDPRIAKEIEAYKLATEAAKQRTPQQLRDLVIHSLVQVILSDDSKPAQKVQAAKVLGTVTEVAAFTERREVTHVKSADDAKRALMEKLRALMTGNATDAVVRDIDALERELTGNDSAVYVNSAIDAPVPDAMPDDAARDPAPACDATAGDQATPTPQDAVWSPTQTMHSVPHTSSVTFSSPDPLPPVVSAADELEAELRNTPGTSGKRKG